MPSLIFDEIKKRHDNNIIDNINKKKFYDLMTRVYNFDINQIMYVRKLPIQIIEYFNKSIRQAKDTLNLNIYEMILFMDEDFDGLNVILSIVDNRNRQTIKDELAKDYGVDYSNIILPEIVW